MVEPDDSHPPLTGADIGLGAPITAGGQAPMQAPVNPDGPTPMQASELGDPLSPTPVKVSLTRQTFLEKYGSQLGPRSFVPKAFQTPQERKAMIERAAREANRSVGKLTG